MKKPAGWGDWAGSPRLTLWLLAGLGVFAAWGSLATPERLTAAGMGSAGEGPPALARLLGLADTFHSPPFIFLLAVLGLNIAWCTARRHRRLPIDWPRAGWRRRVEIGADLLTHLSILLLLGGAGVRSRFGMEGTQYLFFKAPVGVVHEPRRDRDVPLGFSLLLEEKLEEHYPLEAAVGVSAADGRKLGLAELREKRPTAVAGTGLVLTAEGFEEPGAVRVRIEGSGPPVSLALATSGGEAGSGKAGTFRLTLVEYRREIRRRDGRLTILEDGRQAASYVVGPNRRVVHRGLAICQTGWGADSLGNAFMTIQVSRDPGAPVFWTGIWLLGLSLPLLILARRRGKPDAAV